MRARAAREQSRVRRARRQQKLCRSGPLPKRRVPKTGVYPATAQRLQKTWVPKTRVCGRTRAEGHFRAVQPQTTLGPPKLPA